MDRKKAKRWGLLCLAVIIAGGVVFMRMDFKGRNRSILYEASGQTLQNPLMGYAVEATDPEAVAGHTLVYVDVTWRELEPAEGEYAFSAIDEENNLQRWRDEGKRAVLRFLCDRPSGEPHRDVPDWLYEQTGDGVDYDMEYGLGYAPDYDNSVFIEAHERAIQALGVRYGQDDFVAYIELGSLGHWGEWHVKEGEGLPPIPKASVRLRYIQPYREAFPGAKILMRRPFEAAKEYGFGVYNDMTGERESTEEWLTWLDRGGVYEQTGETQGLVSIPKVWRSAPVGGEFTSSLSMDWMLRFHLDETLALIRRSHMTFIGPKAPVGSDAGATCDAGTQEVLKTIGYRLRIAKAVLRESFLRDAVSVSLEWHNDGAAPMYWSWPAYLYVLDSQCRLLERVKIDIDLTGLTDGATVKTKTTFDNPLREKGRYLCVGIEDPASQQPAVGLAMEAESLQRKTVLLQW